MAIQRLNRRQLMEFSEKFDDYLAAGNVPENIKTIEMARQWADGATMREIADSRAVSMQWVSQALRPLVLKVLNDER